MKMFAFFISDNIFLKCIMIIKPFYFLKSIDKI